MKFEKGIKLKNVITILETGEEIPVITTRTYNDKDMWEFNKEEFKKRFSESAVSRYLFIIHFMTLMATRDKIKYSIPSKATTSNVKMQIGKDIISLSDTELETININTEDNFSLGNNLEEFDSMSKVIEVEITLKDV